jgi:predicted GNAT family acetyltransferase
VALDDDRVIGTIIGFPYGQKAAAVGMVIVDDAYQGKGYGRRLMQAMLDQLGDRTVMLQATFRARRCMKSWALSIAACCISIRARSLAPLASLRSGERIRPLGASEQSPGDLYSRATGTDRHSAMRALTAQDRSVVLTRDDIPVGFALLRRFGRGWSVAPVIAPDSDGAKALILHWLAQNAGNFTRLDVTEASGLSPWRRAWPCPRGYGPHDGSRSTARNRRER